MDNYSITHLHSMYSNGTTNIDSVVPFELYVKKAKECGIKTVIPTEHGNVFGWNHKKKVVEAAGMKYVHAIEAYITESLDEKVRDNYHCCLYARNYDGFLELNELISKSFNRATTKSVDDTERFYYSPRITFDELINTSDNIIISTACLAGILSNGTDAIRERFICFLALNKHRCFLELQHHNTKNQIEYNKYLKTLSDTINVPLITGTDTHSLDERYANARSLLQKSKNVHFENEDEFDLVFKTYDELVEAYKTQKSLPIDVVMDAISNTNKLVDMVEEFEIDTSYKYPHLWENSEKLFDQMIQKGLENRGIIGSPDLQKYLDRIEEEKKAYIHNGAIDFMLLMKDIIDWCEARGIEVGYGRGSVNGSVIAYLLGITEMDSVKFNLNFSRFMNIERVSLSDIDTDYPPSRIDEVKEYLFSHKGLYCSDIVTFNTIADKGAIRDICRGLYKDNPKIDYIKITNDVLDMFNTDPERATKTYPDVFEYFDIIKGTIVSIGTHPCGVVVSPFPITDKVGVCTTSTDPYPVTQINMKEIDSMNYVKLDLLKLDTIELINETCKLAGIERLTPDNIDVNDDKVWKAIEEDTTSIFQWEGSTGSSYIKQLFSDNTINKLKKSVPDLDRMTLLTIGNSAIRPAGASYRDDLGNGIVHKTGSKPIDEFLSNTFGQLVFQESIIEFLHSYCGFTMGQADNVRRGIAKKVGTEQFIPDIIDGYVKTMKEKYGIDEDKSKDDIVAFVKVIEDASNYSFSLNHSLPYSYEGYVSGWLRTYYPLEFLTTALNINIGKEEKTSELTRYANKIGINIRYPKFGHSRSQYYFDKSTNTIYKGIESIKYMNKQVGEELYEISKTKYPNFIKLLWDIGEKTSVDKRQLEILIKCGYFSDVGSGLSAKLLKIADSLDSYGMRKTLSKSDPILSDNVIRAIEPYVSDKLKNGGKSEKQYRIIDNLGFVTALSDVLTMPTASLFEEIKNQIEVLGGTDYFDPQIDKRLVAVTDLDDTYSPKFNAYFLKHGKACEMRVFKQKPYKYKGEIHTVFKNKPFENGDILYIKKSKKLPKVKKVDGKNIEVPGEDIWWIFDYDTVK